MKPCYHLANVQRMHVVSVCKIISLPCQRLLTNCKKKLQIHQAYTLACVALNYPGGPKTTQGVIIYVVITIETTGELKLLTWTKLRLKTCGLSHLTTVILQNDKTDDADDGN